ncbi:helix-turn-helix domain-containing protein [Sphaerisporangium sp. TRM90804]|uniref:PucR family transcriptional regulator n=1 Tax=Sphaerisporangium sp. TRM90804 TaxID=3031113 RepID=UPI00244B5E3D|nr:helix-turn-helix domain-containing protein [Sphaerisporangium sp. TRM90804]MDH2428474.1 helix-turn-helix domain-containing protein [Sphaerisporangium sp. TRM90804]
MDLQEVVDETARVLDASATLEDRAFQLLAYAAQSGDLDTVRRESILRRRASDEVRAYFEGFGIASARGPVRIPADEGLGVLARVCVPLRHREVTYGYLWLLDSGALDDRRLAEAAPLVERAATALAREARARQDLGSGLRDLLSADPEVRASAELDVEGPVAAIAVWSAGGRVVPLWTLPRGVLADAGDPLTAVLAPAAQAGDAAARVQAMYGTPTGVGAPRDDPGEAWRSWREATLALRVAERVPRFAPVAVWAALGVHRLLARLPAAELAGLAAEAAPLEGELAHTVAVYLDRGGRARETAQELGVHRQTLYYRLAKAERLTGLDLADGESRLTLHLGLKAAELLRGPGRS